MAELEKKAAELSLEERLEYLRSRGVEIEEPGSRAEARARAPPTTGGPQFAYLRIPADLAKPITRHVAPAAPGRDALKDLVAPLFADDATMDDRVVERETAQRLKGMMTGSDLKAPSASTIQRLAAPGGAEAYPVSQPSAANGWQSVKLYIDEVGALRQRPLNARAAMFAEAAGLSGLSIHGDAFVGRSRVDGLAAQVNVDFEEAELSPAAAWAAEARARHAQAYEAIPEASKAMKAEETDGYAWSQTNEDVEIRVTDVPPSTTANKKPLGKRAKVSYGRGEEVHVQVDGVTLLRLAPLFAPVTPDDCSWSVDGNEILITIEKRDAREWPSLVLSGAH